MARASTWSPAECLARVDFRLPSLAAVDELLAWIGAPTLFDPDVRLKLEGGLDRPPFEKNAMTAALFAHARALAAEIGFTLEDTASGGGSDGNFLAETVPVLDGLGSTAAAPTPPRAALHLLASAARRPAAPAARDPELIHPVILRWVAMVALRAWRQGRQRARKAVGRCGGQPSPCRRGVVIRLL